MILTSSTHIVSFCTAIGIIIPLSADINVDNIKERFLFTDRHVEKESLAEYIAKKREMFLVQVMQRFFFLIFIFAFFVVVAVMLKYDFLYS